MEILWTQSVEKEDFSQWLNQFVLPFAQSLSGNPLLEVFLGTLIFKGKNKANKAKVKSLNWETLSSNFCSKGPNYGKITIPKSWKEPY